MVETMAKPIIGGDEATVAEAQAFPPQKKRAEIGARRDQIDIRELGVSIVPGDIGLEIFKEPDIQYVQNLADRLITRNPDYIQKFFVDSGNPYNLTNAQKIQLFEKCGYKFERTYKVKINAQERQGDFLHIEVEPPLENFPLRLDTHAGWVWMYNEKVPAVMRFGTFGSQRTERKVKLIVSVKNKHRTLPSSQEIHIEPVVSIGSIGTGNSLQYEKVEEDFNKAEAALR